MFKFLSRIFQGEKEARRVLNADAQNVQVTTEIAERLVEVINESLHLANDSKNVDTKVSRLNVAKDKLEELKKLVSENSFLHLERLDQFEACVKELELEFNGHTNNLTKSVSKLSEENSDILDGFKLSAIMLPKTPLAILKRHGECAEIIPENDRSLSPVHGSWLPQLASEFTFLNNGKTMWSPVGNVPEDGGDLLPYLIKVRETIEQPLSSPSADVTEALTRLAKIKALPGGRAYKYDEKHQLIENNDVIDYFPMVFVDDKRALDFILDEIGALSRNGLTVKHILELHAKGYNSIMSMLEAPDDVLLSVSGIGKKKLDVIRKNLPATTPSGSGLVSRI